MILMNFEPKPENTKLHYFLKSISYDKIQSKNI